MDRSEFLAALECVGLTGDGFADLIGMSRATVRDWGGRYPVPYYARLILWMIADRGGARNIPVRGRRI